MLNVKFQHVLIIYLSLLSLSCKESYDATIDKSQKEIIVVDGGITDVQEPYRVRLTKAVGFNASEYNYDSPANVIGDADVSIADNTGASTRLLYVGKGYYQSDPTQFVGVVGKSYTLNIKTKDGTIYSTTPETILPPATNLSINANITTLNTMVTDAYGSSSIVVKRGLGFNLDAEASKNAHTFLKIQTNVITELFHVEWRKGRGPLAPATFVYCWDVGQLSTLPIVTSTVQQNGLNLIKQYNIGFLQESIYDPKNSTKIKDPPETLGWILACDVFTISEKAYNFYTKMNDQLGAKNSIFDPLPTQLYSNVKCLTDSSKIVLGYFNVASKSTKNVFFSFPKDAIKIVKQDLNAYPRDTIKFGGCQDSIPPAIWHTNGK